MDKLISRLMHHSNQTRTEFCAEYSKTTRNHPVSKAKSEVMELGKLPEDIQNETVFQFSIDSADGLARMFGLLVYNIFVVRLIDLNHKVYG